MLNPELAFSQVVLAAIQEHEGEAARALLMGDYAALRASRGACADAISVAAWAFADAVMEQIADGNEQPTVMEDNTCA